YSGAGAGDPVAGEVRVRVAGPDVEGDHEDADVSAGDLVEVDGRRALVDHHAFVAIGRELVAGHARRRRHEAIDADVVARDGVRLDHRAARGREEQHTRRLEVGERVRSAGGVIAGVAGDRVVDDRPDGGIRHLDAVLRDERRGAGTRHDVVVHVGGAAAPIHEYAGLLIPR